MDFALWETLGSGSPQDEIAALIRVNPDIPLTPDVRIISTFGDIVTCRVPRAKIPEVWMDESIASFKAARVMLPEDDVDPALLPSLPNYFSEGASSDEPLPTDQRRPPHLKETGKNVVMGFIDWGLDFAHPDFLNPDGTSRILAIWDQRSNPDSIPPQPFGYGVVHSQQAINQALTTSNPYKTLNYFPAESDPANDGSHATHVTSIAAGNGHSKGPVGVAPNANIIFVNMSTLSLPGQDKLGDSVSLAEAVRFIFDTAGDAPCVINLSMGRHGEQHDGTTLIEQAFDNLLREKTNRAIIQSSGNYYDRNIHTSGRIRPGETMSFDWVIREGDKTPNQLEIWYSGKDVLDVEVTSPSGGISKRVALGKRENIESEGTLLGRIYHRKQEPNNHDNHLVVYLYPQAEAGQWKISLIALDVLDGRFNAWIERDWGNAKNQSSFLDGDAIADYTTGTICNGCRTIAVGAYNPHSAALELGKFSSAGPTRDGRLKPDLVAPGVHILSARSAPRNSTSPERPLLVRKSGTSMAAPHVAGTVALMYEAAKHPLQIEEVHRLLLGSTQWTSQMESESSRCGSGYLDIEQAVEATRHMTRQPRLKAIPEQEEHVMERVKEFAYSSTSYGNSEQEDIILQPDATSNTRKEKKSKKAKEDDLFGSNEDIKLEAGQDKRYLLKPSADSPDAKWDYTLEGDSEILLVTLDDLPLPPGGDDEIGTYQLLTIMALSPGKAEIKLTLQENGKAVSDAPKKTLAVEIDSEVGADLSPKKRKKPPEKSDKTEWTSDDGGQWEVWVSEDSSIESQSHFAEQVLISQLTRRIEALESANAEAVSYESQESYGYDTYESDDADSITTTMIAESPEYEYSITSECNTCSGDVAAPSITDIADSLLEQGETVGPSEELIRQAMGEANLSFSIPNAAELYDIYTRGGLPHIVESLEDLFEIVATPGAPLHRPIQPGDILIRRAIGEGTLSHAAFIDSSSLLSREQVFEEGLNPESTTPGWYAQVIEGGFLPHSRSHGYARRLLDWNGRLAEGQLVLRPLIEANQIAPKTNEYIAWIQSALNRAIGAGLAVDGISGPKTRQAIIGFQKRQGLVADGIVGPKTEQSLQSVSGMSPPGASSSVPTKTTSTTTTRPPTSSGGRTNIAPDWLGRCQGKTTVLEKFDYDRSVLKPEHQLLIDNLARQIVASQSTSTPVTSVCLVGHTDNTGTDSYNLQLGQSRSDNALNALTVAIEKLHPGLTAGVQLRSFSVGETQPVGDERTENGRSQNRRVAIFLNQVAKPKPKPKPGVCFLPTVSSDDPTTKVIASAGHHNFNAGNKTILGESFNVNGTAFYPAESASKDAPFNKTVAASGTVPIVFLAHGNHATFSNPTNRNNEDCKNAGGFIPIPNHLGYIYFQEMLARMGIISVSINCNQTNCRGGSPTNIRQRAGLIQEAILHFLQKNISADPIFGGRINFAKTGLFGHSRGAEAVLVVPELIKATPTDFPGVTIQSVISLAPTDNGSFTRTPEGYALLMMLPAGDGDVVTNDGAIYYDRGIPAPYKCQLYMHKTNHNFFNREWPKDESMGPPVLSRAEHERILSVYGAAFYRDTLLGDAFRKFLRHDELPPTTPTSEIHISYEETGAVTVDDHENRNIALNTLGRPTSQSGGLTANEFDFSQTGSTTFNSTFFGSTVGMVAQTKSASGTFRSQLSGPTDLTNKELWLRAAEVYNGTSVPATGTGFLIGLEDAKGNIIRVDSAKVANGLPRPYDRQTDDMARFGADFTKTMLKTFRFPVSCFTTGAFDQSKVVAIHVQLNRNDKRAIAFDQFQIV